MSHFLGSSRATYSKQTISGKFNPQLTTANAFMRSYKNAASTMVGTSAGGSQHDDEVKSNNHDILELNLGEGDFSPSEEVAFTDMESADTQECNFDLSNVIPVKQLPKI